MFLVCSSIKIAKIPINWFLNHYISYFWEIEFIVNEERAENNTFDAISLCGGSYFSYPLSSRWLIGSKLLGGYVHYPQLELTDRSVSSRSGFCMGSGVSLTFKAKEYYGIRFFLDYNLLPSHSRNSGEYMNMLTLGSSFMITF